MLLINDVPVKYFTFPGGEIQVTIEPLTRERATLTWKPKNSDDIMLLIMTVNALREAGCYDIYLDCLYLPYARQDRVCSPGQALSLSAMAKILDGLGLNDIRFWDLHNSDKTFQMFPETCIHETEIYDIFVHYKIIDNFHTWNMLLCAPDTGARKKVDDVVEATEIWRAIHFEKERDISTGKIIGIKQSPEDYDMDGFEILVIDDICDGGATFIEIAKELRQHTKEDLYLYVTHGIFSKGLDELLTYYKHIYCHHVLDDTKFKSNEFLTILREFRDDKSTDGD